MLRPRLGQVTLADVSDGMLAVAAGKIATANDAAMRAVKLDLLVDPMPAERYDIIYSLMTLHREERRRPAAALSRLPDGGAESLGMDGAG